jgi:hypothetical protein
MEQMTLIDRVTYFEQLWAKFLPEIPAPKPSDIDWSSCPVKIVEKSIFSTARRFHDRGLVFQGKRHAYNYVAKVCRAEWAKAIANAKEADRHIDAACANDEEYQAYEESATTGGNR